MIMKNINVSAYSNIISENAMKKAEVLLVLMILRAQLVQEEWANAEHPLSAAYNSVLVVHIVLPLQLPVQWK